MVGGPRAAYHKNRSNFSKSGHVDFPEFVLCSTTLTHNSQLDLKQEWEEANEVSRTRKLLWEETNKKTPVLPEWTSKGMFYAEGLPDKSYLVMRFYLLLIDVAYVTRGFQNFQGFNLFSI